MKLNLNQNNKSYDHLANIYQLLERLVFANTLHNARIAHIKQLKDAKKILILGEGDGRFLKQLLELNPECHVDCLDSSKAMLLRTKKRLEENNLSTTSINFVHADALEHQYATNHYDAIVTLFFLDNFNSNQLEELIPKIINSLKQNGKWLVADFQQPQKGFMKYIGACLLWIMYRFFRWQTDIPAKTLANPKAFLAKELSLEATDYFLASLLYSEVWSLDASAK